MAGRPFALAVKVGDRHRFTGNTIGSLVGLVLSEYCSGQSGVQGLITKTGGAHVRTLLVDAAWRHLPIRRGQEHSRAVGPRIPMLLLLVEMLGTSGCTNAGARFNQRRKRSVIAKFRDRARTGWRWSLAVPDD